LHSALPLHSRKERFVNLPINDREVEEQMFLSKNQIMKKSGSSAMAEVLQ
jgi:hypothetical protein